MGSFQATGVAAVEALSQTWAPGRRRDDDPVEDEPAPSPIMRESDIADAYARLIGSLTDYALLLLDTGGHVLTWNRGAERIKGYRAADIIGRHFSTFYTPEAVAVGHPARELEIAALTGEYAEEGWRVRRDGARFWARVQISAIRDDDGELVGFGKVTTDLTQDRQRQEQVANVLALLEQTVRLDHLTGLPNRRALDEQLARQMADAGRDHKPFSIALIDLDHFKAYNDHRGHLAGDKLLKLAAIRWRQALRDGDSLSRYGGEEFVMALPDCTLEQAPAVVERLLAVTPDRQTCSAGVATWDFHESIEELVSRADRALYRAKAAGRDQVLPSDD